MTGSSSSPVRRAAGQPADTPVPTRSESVPAPRRQDARVDDHAPTDEIPFVEISDQSGPQPAPRAEEFCDPDGPRIVGLVQRIIGDAFRLGASRVLILPLRDRVKLAYRIQDSVCQRDNQPREILYPLLVKLMTMVNLAGSIKLQLGGTERRLRATFKPTPHGLSALIEIPQEPPKLELYRAEATRLGYPFVDLFHCEVSPQVLERVPPRIAREYTIFPVAMEGNSLTLAMSNPRTADLDRLQFLLNHMVSPVMATEGAILAAINHHYESSDPETADLLLWELAQAHPDEAPPKRPELQQWVNEAPQAVRAVICHLRTLYRVPMLELFDDALAGPRLCDAGTDNGRLKVIFSQSDQLDSLPPAGRRYIEHKVWALREAILARLEHHLELDRSTRGLAMTYSQYAACRRLAEGKVASINPATARADWINFLYWLALHSFPTIDSNGGLLGLIKDHLNLFEEKIVALLSDPVMVVDADAARGWLGRMEHQTTLDDVVDYDSPSIVSLADLLLSEGFQIRASRIAIVPLEDRVQVAYRVHKTVYCRNVLSLQLLYPLLARLVSIADRDGRVETAFGPQKRTLRLELRSTSLGLAAILEVLPDAAALEAARARAARHHYPWVSLEKLEVAPKVLALCPRGVARRKLVLPLGVRDGSLTVALDQPPDMRRLDELRLMFNRAIAIALVAEDDLVGAIYRHYHPPGGAVVPPAVAELLQHP